MFFPAVMAADAALLVDAKKIYTANNVTVYDFSVAIDGSVNKKKIFIVNDGIKDPKKFIWIFPGYKPAGDPYAQSPRIFIENWKMIQLCIKNGYVCIVPDMGTSMYEMAGMMDEHTVTDMHWLKEAYKHYIFNDFRNAPVIIAGVSTGAEGAVKFSSVIQNVESIIGMSGTYDFFSLPQSSGEYKIHQRVFGDNAGVWRDENPVEILKRSVRMKFYLFCESKSMYFSQAQLLKSQRIANIDVVDYLALGKGKSHNWDFWGSAPVIKTLHEIFLKKGAMYE